MNLIKVSELPAYTASFSGQEIVSIVALNNLSDLTSFQSTIENIGNYVSESILVNSSSFSLLSNTSSYSITSAFSSTASYSSTASFLLEGGSSGTPTLIAGYGAGLFPSASVSGIDSIGTITLTTGTTPATSSNVVTVVFGGIYTNIPVVILTPVNANSSTLVGAGNVYVNQNSCTSASFSILSNTIALSVGETLQWNYLVKF